MACILITDDDDILRHMLGKALAHAGHTVFEAPDGGASLKLCQREKVDLVITDVIMPDMDGIELIRTLRTERPSLKIICISGGGLINKNIYLEIAQRLGVHGAFSKPFRIEAMIAAIDEILKK